MAGPAALALALSACQGGGPGRRDATFSVADFEPDHLTPGRTTRSASIEVIDGLFEGLTRLDATSGKPVDDEAESITTRDQRTWTIRIRPSLTFHNGEPVTAQSYVEAWNTVAYGPNGWQGNSYFAHFDGYSALNPAKGTPKSKTLRGLKVIDQRTFTARLSAPFSQFALIVAYPGFAPMPQVAYANPDAYDQAPVGNGPFMMDGGWQHNKLIKLKKYTRYGGTHPAHADGVRFEIYADRDVAYTDLRAGKTDIMMNLPAARVPDARRLFRGRLVEQPGGAVDLLGFPNWDARFANPDLRRAISMAIDRQGIVNAILNAAYMPLGSLLAPIIPGYRANPCGAACTYDPAAARRLLKRAGGWKGPLYLAVSTADPTFVAWMTAIANELKQNLGLHDVRLQTLPAGDYLVASRNHQVKGPFWFEWIMDYPSAQDFLTPLYGPGNEIAYHSRKFTDLVAGGDAAASLPASIRFYQRAEDVVLHDMPVTPLWSGKAVDAYTTRVGNVHFEPYDPAGVRLEDVEVK